MAQVRSVPDLDTREVIGGRTLLAVAARVEPARLIDNLVLEVGPDTVTEASLMGT